MSSKINQIALLFILSLLGVFLAQGPVKGTYALRAEDVSLDGIRLGMSETELPPTTSPELENVESIPRSTTQANFDTEGLSELIYGKVLKIDEVGTFESQSDIAVFHSAIGEPHLELKLDNGYLQGWQYEGWWIDCFLEGGRVEKIDSFGLGLGRLRWEMSVKQTTP